MSNIADIEDCNIQNEFNVQLAIALSKSDFLFAEQFKGFFKKCNPRFSERTLDLLHYPYKKGDRLKDILSFLKSRGFSKDELLNITKIWKHKYEVNSGLGDILATMKSIEETKSSLEKYSLFNKLIELGKKSKSIFIKNLILSVSYGQIGNKGLLTKYFKELMSINEIIYSTDLIQDFVTQDNKKKYYSLINTLFNLLRESLPDEKMIRILDTNFQFIDIKKEFIELESEELNWSLNELRENMNTSLYGVSLPSFWVKSVVNRTSERERDKFIKKVEKQRILKSISILDYWIFKESLSPDDSVRNFIVNKIDDSYGESISGDYVILELLEDGVFKNNLGRKNKEFKKPIFTLKRNLFYRALEDGRETSFPILKLIGMGEENKDFIWWLIL